MTIGEKIKKARTDAKMTQKELAEKCGMADSAIRKYESGKVVPKLDTIAKIARAMVCMLVIWWTAGQWGRCSRVQIVKRPALQNLSCFPTSAR